MRERPGQDARSVLEQVEVLAGLEPDVLDQLFARMGLVSYGPGDALMRQGDTGNCLMVLLEGTASASLRSPAGRRSRVSTLGRADVVGEMALLTDRARIADVVAETRVEALVLPVEDFHAVASLHPEFGIVLTELLAARLGRRADDGLGGMVVEGFRIDRCVGRGGMAIVYEARAVDSGKRVALKMLHHRLMFEQGALENFEREARIVEGLNHPNVMSLLTHFPAYKTRFLVLEYCDGPTLETVLERSSRLPEAHVRPILGQLAGALHHVHRKGIVHRDLKPGNVMLTRGGRVKLGDFGLARTGNIEPAGGADPRLSGTMSYMAPEQLQGGAADPLSDIYALAGITYELLQGRLPWTCRGLTEHVERKRALHLPARESIGEGVTAELYDFLERGLAPRPEDRRTCLATLSRWAGPLPASVVRRARRHPSPQVDRGRV